MMEIIKKYYLELILILVCILLFLWISVFYHQRMEEELEFKKQAETLRYEKIEII